MNLGVGREGTNTQFIARSVPKITDKSKSHGGRVGWGRGAGPQTSSGRNLGWSQGGTEGSLLGQETGCGISLQSQTGNLTFMMLSCVHSGWISPAPGSRQWEWKARGK